MSERQSELSARASQPGGAVSFPSKATEALTLRERDSHGILKVGEPEVIHRHGLSVSRAKSEDLTYLRALLGRELVQLMRAVKVNNTFSNEEDIYTAVDDIIEEFKTLKVEEVVHVFAQIRRGKIEIYGRLDTPTICKALRDYDVNVACEFREKHYKEAIQEEALASRSFQEIIDSLPEVRPTFAEILSRRPKLGPQEREEIKARDRERWQQSGQP